MTANVPHALTEVLGGSPVGVPVEADPAAKPLQCFWNVRDVVSRNGGEVVYGLQILTWPGVLYQCEHHAVWRRPDGTLVDPTPNDEGASVTLFVPRPDLPFTGWQIPTRRFPMTKDPKVARFCVASDVADKLRVSVQREPHKGSGKIYYDIKRLSEDHQRLFWEATEHRERLYPHAIDVGRKFARRMRRKARRNA